MKQAEIKEREEKLQDGIHGLVRDFQSETGCEVRSITVRNDADRFGPPKLLGVEVEIVVDVSDTE